MPDPETIRGVAKDALDDELFDFNDDDDVFQQFHPTIDAPTRAQEKPKSADLGLDEEIKVSRKRRPIAKLDEERLLSARGIPKLRRITRERLRFKGKGHELWLDDLYPRAKFLDGLFIIEKLGHKNRLKVMRKEWMDEAKRSSREATRPDSIQKNLTSPQPEAIPLRHREIDKNTQTVVPEVPEEPSRDQRQDSFPPDEESLFVTSEQTHTREEEALGDELDELMAELGE